MKDLRIAVNQRFLPHYRLEFYRNAIGRLNKSGHTLRLFFSFALGEVPSQPWAVKLPALRMKMRLGELTDTAVFAPFILLRLIGFWPDVVVLEDISNLPTSLLATIFCKISATPYLIWGLGNVPGKTRSRLRRLLSPFVAFFYKNSAGFICYSRWAESVYQPYGKPTFLAPNACLDKPGEQEASEILQKIEERIGRPTCCILTVGELKPQKKFDVLLQALALSKNLDFELRVIGEGPQRADLAKLAEALELGKKVVFHGAVYDQAAKKAIIEGCALGVLPGRGGLVLQEMMYHGLPVICGPADGTEKDRVVDRYNGFLLEDPITPEKLAAAIRFFAQAPPDRKREYSMAALETVMDGYNITSMVDGFIKAVYTTCGAAEE